MLLIYSLLCHTSQMMFWEWVIHTTAISSQMMFWEWVIHTTAMARSYQASYSPSQLFSLTQGVKIHKPLKSEFNVIHFFTDFQGLENGRSFWRSFPRLQALCSRWHGSPLGSLAPRTVNFSGSLRNSTMSFSSCFASSTCHKTQHMSTST